jgi:hypothetical protein
MSTWRTTQLTHGLAQFVSIKSTFHLRLSLNLMNPLQFQPRAVWATALKSFESFSFAQNLKTMERGLWLLELLTFSHQRLLWDHHPPFTLGPDPTGETRKDWILLSLLNVVPWWSAVWSRWLIRAKEELLKEGKKSRLLFCPPLYF